MSSFWTPQPHFRGGSVLFKAFSLRTCGLLCALLLSSCGQSMPDGYQASPESTVTSGTLNPLTVPPNANDSPPLPGTTGAPKTADGLPVLQAKGANTALFSKKISDEADRLDRLENAVQELRNDFDAMSPSIVRLIAIEGDIQNLIKQLEVLTGNGGASASTDIAPIEEATLDAPQSILPATPEIPLPPPGSMDEEREYLPAAQEAPLPLSPAQETAAPLALPAPPPPAEPEQNAAPPSIVTDGPSVTGIRVGEHPGKTRIVLDVRGKTGFTADLDNQEHILVVELPQAAWGTEMQKNFTGNPVLASYTAEKLGDSGTRLIVQLKKTASLPYKVVLDNADGATSRVIIDIAAQ